MASAGTSTATSKRDASTSTSDDSTLSDVHQRALLRIESVKLFKMFKPTLEARLQALQREYAGKLGERILARRASTLLEILNDEIKKEAESLAQLKDCPEISAEERLASKEQARVDFAKAEARIDACIEYVLSMMRDWQDFQAFMDESQQTLEQRAGEVETLARRLQALERHLVHTERQLGRHRHRVMRERWGWWGPCFPALKNFMALVDL